MGYVIAAYIVVIGSLIVYGVWVQTQRRALMRAERTPSEGTRPGGASPNNPASTDTAN